MSRVSRFGMFVIGFMVGVLLMGMAHLPFTWVTVVACLAVIITVVLFDREG